jgi:hypothetical protein
LASASEIEVYAEHLAECEECEALHFESIGLTRAVRALRGVFEEAEPFEEHLAQEELIRYAAGDFRGLDLDEIQAHLNVCDLCRGEVSGHQQWIATIARPRHLRSRIAVIAAVAASVCVGILLTVWNARKSDPVPAPRVRTPTAAVIVDRQNENEWSAMKAEVRRTGVLPLPGDIRAFAAEDVVRGAPEQRARGKVSPSSTTVMETTPTLRWPSVAGSSAIVSVRSGRDLVAQSPLLSASEWRVTPELERGKVYRWQVLVQRGDESFVMPAPPAPPALFRVLDDSDVATVERARSQKREDHLLMAVVYARAGLIEAAGAELDALDRMTGDPLAKVLLGQLPQH